MKRLFFVLAFLTTLSIVTEGHNPHRRGQWSASYQNFYDELMPYGEWIYSYDYGYVWRPYVSYNEDFRPYATRGHWVYTHLGWTWVSDYRWGWATFHYGRWYFDDYYGWAWIPGDEWAPAWVTWGSYNDCWAWAPLGPGMHAGVSFTVHVPSFWWTAVPRRHFCSRDWHRYTYSRPVQVTNINYITNIYRNDHRDRNERRDWHHGPRVSEVERHAGRTVTTMEIAHAERPGNTVVRNNRVDIYRPEIRKERESTAPRSYSTPERRVTPSTSVNRTTPANTVESRTRTTPEHVNQAPASRDKVKEPVRNQVPGRERTVTQEKRSGTYTTKPPVVTSKERNDRSKDIETRKSQGPTQSARKPATSSENSKRTSGGDR